MAIPKKRTAKRQAKKSLAGPTKPAVNGADLRTYTIRDYRLEKPSFTLRQVRSGDALHYQVVSGDLSTPAPPIRESKYLSREQCIEIYRWMLLNRRMETALENLYKQGKGVDAISHFKEAQRLDPDNWNYKRQAWALSNADRDYGTNFGKEVKKLNGRPYYEPHKLPEVKKGANNPRN